MATYYHNPKCSKSLAGLKILNDNKITFEIKEYLTEKLTYSELENILNKLNLMPDEIIRKKDPSFDKFKETFDRLSVSEQIKVIIDNPSLLERPILVLDHLAAIGRPPESLLSIIDK